jgi:hypothetical protein
LGVLVTVTPSAVTVVWVSTVVGTAVDVVTGAWAGVSLEMLALALADGEVLVAVEPELPQAASRAALAVTTPIIPTRGVVRIGSL